MNSNAIGPATVKMTGGLEVSGSQLKQAKLTFIGGSPNATAKLWSWDGKFREYDTLKQATITENPNNPDFLTITGVSQLAKEEGQGTFDEADCMVTWEVQVTGRCGDCA